MLAAPPAFSQSRNTDLLLFFDLTDHFLTEFTKNGTHDWAHAQESKDLISLRELIKEIKLENESISTTKAYYINVYNLILIDELSASYPIEKTTEVKGLFNKTKHKINGEKLTLNELEEKLFRDFDDVRIHLVLFKGNISGSKLVNRAITSKNIEVILNKRTHEIINDSKYVNVDRSNLSVTLPQLFEKYRINFKSIGGLMTFINSYRTTQIPEHYHFIFKKDDKTLLKKQPAN